MNSRHSKNIQLFQATQAAHAVFKHYDTDNNGYLDYRQAEQFLKQILQGNPNTSKTPEEFIGTFFSACDENKDKKITQKQLTEVLFMILVNKRRNMKNAK